MIGATSFRNLDTRIPTDVYTTYDHNKTPSMSPHPPPNSAEMNLLSLPGPPVDSQHVSNRSRWTKRVMQLFPTIDIQNVRYAYDILCIRWAVAMNKSSEVEARKALTSLVCEFIVTLRNCNSDSVTEGHFFGCGYPKGVRTQTIQVLEG